MNRIILGGNVRVELLPPSFSQYTDISSHSSLVHTKWLPKAETVTDNMRGQKTGGKVALPVKPGDPTSSCGSRAARCVSQKVSMDANLQNVLCLHSSGRHCCMGICRAHCRPARVGISDRRLRFCSTPESGIACPWSMNSEWMGSLGEQGRGW